MLQRKNAVNEATDKFVRTFDAWCRGASKVHQNNHSYVSSVDLPSDSLRKNLARWAVTQRTLKITKLSKLGGGHLLGYGRLHWTIRYSSVTEHWQLKSGVVSLIPGKSQPFHFPLFLLHTATFLCHILFKWKCLLRNVNMHVSNYNKVCVSDPGSPG